MHDVNHRLVLGLSIFLSCFWFASVARSEKAPAPPMAVNVASVVRQDVPRIISVIGTVLPAQTVVIHPRIDSQITEIKFHDGDTVKKGDVLFVLDDRTLKAQLLQAQSTLERDQAQYKNLQLQCDRAEKLVKKGFSAKSTYDDAKAALDVQEATVDADEASVENARVQLSYTTIEAPIDGRTGTINVTLGNTVKASDTQSLVIINQIQPILVQASLPQIDFDAVRQATETAPVPVVATRTGSKVSANGKLQYIDNAVDQSTGTFITRAIFQNEDKSLWPGMMARLAVQTGEDKQSLVIPEIAVQHGQTGDYVFVIANGNAHKRDIVVSRVDTDMAVIDKGLQEKEAVAFDGFMSLQDGLDVTVAPAEKKSVSGEAK